MSLAVQALDHVGVTVANLDEAVALFTELFGARELYRRSYAPPEGSDEMQRQFAIHPDSSFRLSKVEIAGAYVELFEYTTPDQHFEPPRSSDVGGHHLALRVPDIEAAVAGLRADGRVQPFGQVQTLPESHPLAGRRWIYAMTRWGLLVELVSDPG